MLEYLLSVLSRSRTRFERARTRRRWAQLQALGMHIGQDVLLPSDLYIDANHCHHISIGDHCGFGPQCLILAHDAQMDEFLDAARLGLVTINESCHIGARCVIMPGVEIGPRTIVGAGSVVSRSLPPDSVCAGNPARVLCTLAEYLDKHSARLAEATTFAYDRYDQAVLTAELRGEMVDALARGAVYMVGGRTAELAGRGGTHRTPHLGSAQSA